MAGLYGSDPPPRRPWASLSPAMEDGHAGDFDFYFFKIWIPIFFFFNLKIFSLAGVLSSDSENRNLC